jgi:hypothetical protein
MTFGRWIDALELSETRGQSGSQQDVVHRAWKEAGLKPHRIERYLASDDPDFESKAADILGLYVNPPPHAAVFCVDEKTAIQALDRFDPLLRFRRTGSFREEKSILLTVTSPKVQQLKSSLADALAVYGREIDWLRCRRGSSRDQNLLPEDWRD